MSAYRIWHHNRITIGNVYKVRVGISEGRRPLERPRRKWGDNIKWIAKKYGGRMWSGLSGSRRVSLAGSCEYFNDSSGYVNVGKLFSSRATISFSRTIQFTQLSYLRGHVAQMGEKKRADRVLVAKHDRKKLLGRPRCRW
jgi:hypothetical protein